VPNRDGFLDEVWARAPFRSHGRFVATVRGVSGRWAEDDRYTAEERAAIVTAAVNAREEL
jgi:hypothetical protein